MPVEALPAADGGKGVRAAAPLAVAMPVRILRKGPAYFRRGTEPGTGRPSAVERLEADKVKYVKSQRVASTRQEPVRPPPPLKQPLLTPGVRRTTLTPNRRASPKTSLDLDILNNLINLCDSPFPKVETPRAWRAEVPAVPGDVPEGLGKSPGTPVATAKPPGNVAVRRVDVRPCMVPQGQATPVPASPVPGTLAARGSPAHPDSARRLHRSKSDLSDRLSRATADLERFFNYCGLDPEDVRELGTERFARASSDIVSLQFQSVSTASSEGGQSPPSAASPEGPAAQRVPYGISVIERNARVIKWLYGLRQARETQQVSDV
ncbi:F110A protein, partial [Upupa epops]|nr:F110A protein [Upupa epops]